MSREASSADSDIAGTTRARVLRWAMFVTAAVFTISGAAWLGYLYWPRRMPPVARRLEFRPETTASGVRVSCPGLIVTGTVARFDDELFAWLMFDQFRSAKRLGGRRAVLVSDEIAGKPSYSIHATLDHDIENAIGTLVELRSGMPDSKLEWGCVTPATIQRWTKETELFIDAYTGPAKRVLEHIPPARLQLYLRRFIRFKSETDPRIQGNIEPVPSPLTGDEAGRLAADIIAVAGFYDLPIDIFLGIGAMENNYMNVPGDLHNTVWKRTPAPGDIVLRRLHGRVLVRNDSMGVWQITRESLRYAHALFRADKRNYNALPQRLRPPEALNINDVSPEVLTTYAGLLLRNLIDLFHGDVSLATGAYNGGPGAPNVRYAEGVRNVASYARRVLERASAIQGISTANVRIESTHRN